MKKHHTLLHIDRQGHNQTSSSTLSTLRLLSPGIRSIEPVTVSSDRSSRSSVSLITKNFTEGLVGHLPESFPILLEGVSTTSTDTAISLDLTIDPYKATAQCHCAMFWRCLPWTSEHLIQRPLVRCAVNTLSWSTYSFLILNNLLSIFSSAQINSTSFIDLLWSEGHPSPLALCRTNLVGQLPDVRHFQQQLPKMSQVFGLNMALFSSNFKSGCALIALASRVTKKSVCRRSPSPFYFEENHQTCW